MAGSPGEILVAPFAKALSLKYIAPAADDFERESRMPATPHAPHALVTGGGRGIGRAIAAGLAKQGMTVTVLGRQRMALDQTVAAGEAHFADVADVADRTAITAAINRAAERQPIDILVANAGAAE